MNLARGLFGALNVVDVDYLRNAVAEMKAGSDLARVNAALDNTHWNMELKSLEEMHKRTSELF